MEPGTRSPCTRERFHDTRMKAQLRRCGSISVEPSELERRKILRADLLDAGVPCLHELNKIIKGSRSLITLTDEEGVVLDVVGGDEIREMKNFPRQGRSTMGR